MGWIFRENRSCLKTIYEHINDNEVVKALVERIGNFRALQASFYILQYVMKENSGGEPNNAKAFYIISDKNIMSKEFMDGQIRFL